MKTPDPLTIPQGSLITPVEPILLDGCKTHPGQTFWVVSAAYIRPTQNCIRIARSGKNMSHAFAVSFEDFARFFSAVSDFTEPELTPGPATLTP